MASPDEIALYEQELGRILTPQEIATLDAERGVGGTVFEGAPQGPAVAVPGVGVQRPQMSTPDPLMSVPAQVGEQAFDAGVPEAGTTTGLQIPGIGEVTTPAGLEPPPVPSAQIDEEPTEEQELDPATQLDPGPESPFPRIDLSAIQGRRPSGGGGGRFRREAEAARGDVEAAREASGEALRGVQEAVGETRDRLISSSVDREVAEEILKDQYAPQRDEAQELYDSKIRELDEANRAAADIEVKDRRTVGQKVMGALATAFGAFAQAKASFAGGSMPNIGAQLVERSIERDLEEQKIDLANARDTASAKRTELSAAYQKLGDIREAEAVARQSLRDKYAIEAQEIVGTLNDEQQVAELEGMIQGMREKSGLEREAIAERRAQLAAAAAARRRKEQQLAAQKTLDAIQRYETSQNLAGGLQVVDPTRFGSITGDDKKKQAEIVRDTAEQVERSDAVISIIDRIQDLRAKTAARLIPYSEANAQLESLGNQLTLGINTEADAGALDQGMQDITNGITGDFNSIEDVLTGTAGDKLEAYKGSAANKQDRYLRSRGLAFRRDTPNVSAQKAALQSRTRPLVE